MSAVISPSDTDRGDLERANLQSLRVDGGVALEFASGPAGTYAARVAESDGHRARFPDRYDRVSEAHLLNTGGGIAGGDRIAFTARCGEGAHAIVTSVAAERLYRAAHTPSRIAVDLHVAPRASLVWMPQETLLYDGARLVRRIAVDVADDAAVTLIDIVVFGRRGSGETLTSGALDDRWSIRRNGRLVHAEAVQLGGAIDAVLSRSAVASGAHVIGMLVHVSPDAEEHRDAVRSALTERTGVTAAVSAWGGKLVVRAIGTRSDRLRATLGEALARLTNHPQSRVWNS